MLAAYDRLVTAIGDRAGDSGDRPIATHGPDVGSAGPVSERAVPAIHLGPVEAQDGWVWTRFTYPLWATSRSAGEAIRCRATRSASDRLT